MTYRTVSSELLVDAPILALRRDRVTTVTGEVTREVVEHFSAAAVVAVRTGADGTREVMLVRQYRRPVDRYLWELPAGILDMVGESPLTAAQRELVEEAGLQAASWHLLGDVVTSPGTSEEMCRIFLAEDVTGVPEADMTRRWLPVDEAVAWVRDGRVENSIAVAGILQLAVGTRRDVTEPFAYHSSLAERRAPGRAPGTDMKHER